LLFLEEILRMRRSISIGLACAAAGLLTAAWYFSPDDVSAANAANAATQASTITASATAALAAAPSAGAGVGAVGTASGPLSPEGQRARQAQLALWQARYERAEQTYANYRDITRYPHYSRPLAEHPDQVRPFAPVSEEAKVRNAKGEPVEGIKLRTTQEKVFASGTDTVKLTVEVVDDKGQAVPITIASAAAQSVAETKVLAQTIQTSLPFDDQGQGADSVAGDRIYSARLNPSVQGFGNYAGTIRVLLQFSAKGEPGVAHFDVIYNPDVPAAWAGVREAVEEGSLNFYLKAQVLKPGRYVVSARVDDANGQPFALLQFNDEVPAGAREFKLHVFGALIQDKRPVFPLRVRDVDGFLLYADRFPDRAMMARQSGAVHTSARYSLDRFVATEWSSEERERYLAEYAKDAETARTQVERLSGR
jgi:hypothetical protein